MAIDIAVLEKGYFYYDKPVPYKLSDDYKININPITISDGEIFNSSIDLLQIDKNSINSVEIIQMSYLDFIIKVMILGGQDRLYLDKLCNILKLCIGLEDWGIVKDEKDKFSITIPNTDAKINGKQFEDIRRIILYQNILHYDDSYIDPDLKKSMQEVDRLKNSGYLPPSLERKIAIITAHCGLSKKEQLKYTMRSHQLLFEECAGEVEFLTLRPIAMYSGTGKNMEHWIYKKQKNKFDGYITSVETYNKSMGGDGKVKQADSNLLSTINKLKK